MSSFLSVAEDIAGQRQNVRRELKKMEEESRAVEFHKFLCFYSGFCIYQKSPP